ncbi:hypothetical protein JKP88DRAFT_310941 [Tribonema minus]|uniref:Uncharacterized protein n=1 Tax=Tribonema minus TaxID=303371 RepID=A0A835Z1P8_9STRA|nr:hypothetical protein JKP88DRAFT_310941 [Tribonema minus]
MAVLPSAAAAAAGLVIDANTMWQTACVAISTALATAVAVVVALMRQRAPPADGTSSNDVMQLAQQVTALQAELTAVRQDAHNSAEALREIILSQAAVCAAGTRDTAVVTKRAAALHQRATTLESAVAALSAKQEEQRATTLESAVATLIAKQEDQQATALSAKQEGQVQYWLARGAVLGSWCVLYAAWSKASPDAAVCAAGTRDTAVVTKRAVAALSAKQEEQVQCWRANLALTAKQEEQDTQLKTLPGMRSAVMQLRASAANSSADRDVATLRAVLAATTTRSMRNEVHIRAYSAELQLLHARTRGSGGGGGSSGGGGGHSRSRSQGPPPAAARA